MCPAGLPAADFDLLVEEDCRSDDLRARRRREDVLAADPGSGDPFSLGALQGHAGQGDQGTGVGMRGCEMEGDYSTRQ